MSSIKRIVHVDMDAFYASVEQRDDPALRGRPVVVGGARGRGVVCAASYEARRFGVRSAMPMARALRLCRQLVVVPPDFARYHAVSEQVFAIFQEVTPLVEPLSLDGGYLDVTENAWGLALGVEVAQRIKDRIRQTVNLTASAGVAPNKFLAKIASGWKKPDGLTVIAPGRVEAFLHKLPVDALWGVGPVTAKRLATIGITRLLDIRTADPAALRSVVGSYADSLVELAHGIDHRVVSPDRTRRSVGSETTFALDLTGFSEVRARVDSLARELAEWLEGHETVARTVTLKVRYSDFETITRSDTRGLATRDPDELAGRAVGLLDRTAAGERPVRLLGVSLHGLESQDEPGQQLLLPFGAVA